jgi:hypothetical protein
MGAAQINQRPIEMPIACIGSMSVILLVSGGIKPGVW